MNRLPEPRREPDGFNAWALMYLERELSLEEERAFEGLLARSAEAATAFARVAELDTALFEHAGSAAMPADAEALDPRNAGHMQFVSEVCSQMRVVQRVPPHPRTVEHPAATGSHWWVPALAAAGILIGVAIYLTSAGSRSNPSLSQKDAVPPRPAQPSNEPELARKQPVEEHDIVVQRREPATENEAVQGPSTERTNAGAVASPARPPVVQPQTTPPESEVAEQRPAPEVRISVKEVAAKADPQHELGSGGDHVHRSAGEVDLATNIWRATGDLPLERLPASVKIPLISDDKDVWKRGGLIYLVPQSLSRGRPSLSLEVTGPLFSSPLHDFEFIVTNKPHGGTLITLSVTRENLEEIRKFIDLKRPTHTFELIVWRFDRYEILVDGHTFYFYCETLEQNQWGDLYLGFRGVSRNTGPEASLLVKQVKVGSVGKQEKK